MKIPKSILRMSVSLSLLLLSSCSQPTTPPANPARTGISFDDAVARAHDYVMNDTNALAIAQSESNFFTDVYAARTKVERSCHGIDVTFIHNGWPYDKPCLTVTVLMGTNAELRLIKTSRQNPVIM